MSGGAVEAADSSSNPLTLLAMSDRFSDRTRRLLGAYMVGRSALKLGKTWWNKAQAQRTYTIAVIGDDNIYPDVHRWLLASLPKDRQRAVTAQSSRESNKVPLGIGETAPPAGINLFYDGTRTQTVEIDGHKITVSLERPEWARGYSSDDESRRWSRSAERVLFTATSIDGRDAVLGFLAEVAEAQQKRTPRLYSVNRWSDGWMQTRDLPTRPLETVVLREGQQERLVDDLRRFLTQEQDYASFGVPYHRGYLLHGPPGTGKTSVAKAIAGHFGLDVYYVPLTALKDDTILNSLFAQVDPRSVLLLEDIDIVHGARDGDEQTGGVTLQGLLNTLDGFATPHGLIMVMTTNNLEVLDPRLVRPGRVDVMEEIGEVDHDQLRRLVSVFIGPWEPPARFRGPVAPAAVVEVLKRNLNDRDGAVRDLAALLA